MLVILFLNNIYYTVLQQKISVCAVYNGMDIGNNVRYENEFIAPIIKLDEFQW